MIFQRFGSWCSPHKIAGFLAGTAFFLLLSGVPARAQDRDPAELDVQPKVTRQQKPIYPFAMHRLGITGQVIVAFIVQSDGRVGAAYAVKASHPSFRQAAIDAVERWRFEPGRKDGRAVDVRMQVPIIFNITGEPQNLGWKVKRPREFPETIPRKFRWDDAPVLVDYSPPVYPRQALLEKRYGKVTVSFMVSPTGQVIQTQAEPDGDPDFQGAAVAAAETFRFKPAKLDDGTPCGAILKMEFDFYLSSDRSDAPYTDEMRRIIKVLSRKPDSLPGLKDLDKMPRPVAQRAPTVPPELQRKGQPAKAMVEFIISRSGLVLLPRVVETTDEAFGYAAVHAVADWGFVPPVIDGKPVDVIARVPVAYNPEPSGD
ncbi:TonB family protein [Actomonas aquatica]|uniref:TonB family protein n=1 Tax=Actomonas aquatica TaxID=2866162 RepID=A0ABZ1C476_9BACT|nr:TonB family protein [Opitutus sp. WL0086]WRQ86103.1 TonB family protein [Opitutus sp. WL0086]